MNSQATFSAPPARASDLQSVTLGQVSILDIPLASIRPSPKNNRLYRPVTGDDPDVRALAESLREHGQKEPLVLTLDNFILSGHRRFQAARMLRWKTLRCRYENVRRSELSSDEYLTLLREFNRQSVKSRQEMLREEVVSADPLLAYSNLREHRARASAVAAEWIELHESKGRSKLSPAKSLFLAAAVAVVEALRPFWPLSVRQVHYQLLNDPPLINTHRSDSRYANQHAFYKALCVLMTQARHEGRIPHSAIHDPTRPVTLYRSHQDVHTFLRDELALLLNGYMRDLQQSQPSHIENLQQSQPSHIEIVGEKNTVESILKPVAEEYCIPLTIGRGFASTPPRHAMAQRFRKSGKEKLVLLALSDFDPDGEEIAHSFARSMRDDFGIRQVAATKVALRADQVRSLALPPNYMRAKPDSVNYPKFKERYGSDEVYELEAVPPAELQRLLREAIEGVLDHAAFDAEVSREAEDAGFLETARRRVLATWSCPLGGPPTWTRCLKKCPNCASWSWTEPSGPSADPRTSKAKRRTAAARKRRAERRSCSFPAMNDRWCV